jgi:amino acid adenylation domain-containing protein/non-ribosomal peptide synthase protein (TIGR01720 family)
MSSADPGDLPTLFETTARALPGAVALQFGGTSWSYAELDARANRLARQLRHLGCRPETVVGVCLPMSFGSAQGMLAIMKAEGAYLPMDPAYPDSSLRAILADSDAQVLVTSSALRSRFAGWRGHVLCIDADAADWAARPASAPARRPLADSLAYVMYTSGSTGRPKGVAITHRGPVNYFAYLRGDYGLGPGDLVLQLAPLSFDASIRDLLGPLACGATVALRHDGMTRDPAVLAGEISRRGVTVICSIIPSLLARLMDIVERAGIRLPALRLVLTSAEPLPTELARRVEQRFGCRVFSQYGATECTMSTTRCGLDGAAPGDAVVPAGQPIPGTQVYVLDERERAVAAGVAGDIYIGGVGLARGYWNDPGLTAERFVAAGPDGGPPRRLYRTGDRGRIRPDGQLIYLGRRDNQIKVRGHRVAPEEIEACLREHPDVTDAVVVGYRRGDGQTRLHAYLVAGRTMPTAAGISAHLAGRLPAHLRPHHLFVLDELPRNHNGKVDRLAISVRPARELAPAGRGARVNGHTESALARIWRDILQADEVSADDDFFALGGDSLQLFDILARARLEGIALSYAEAVSHPTIRGFAAAATAAAARPVVADRVAGTPGYFPLSPAQEWLFALDHPERDHWNQAVMLTVQPGTDPARLRDAMQLMVERHAALRLRFRNGDAVHRQEYRRECAPDVWAQADLSGLDDDTARRMLRTTADSLNTSLDLARGVPFRACHIDLGRERPGRLLLVAHQLVVDRLSWRLLLADLQRTTTVMRAGLMDDGRASACPFRAWVEHLVRRARSEDLRAQLPYWLALGADGLAAVQPDLPGVDTGQVDDRAADACVVERWLSPAQTAALVRSVRAAPVTSVEDILLAALAVALGPWLGESAVLLDVGGHGRGQAGGGVDVSATVGWFVSQFPMVLVLRPGASAAETAALVARHRAEVPEGGFGYGLLRYLGPESVRSALFRRPRAQISFNYLGTTDERLAPGVLFGIAPEAAGSTVSGRAQRPHLLEVGSAVSQGRLCLTWTYNSTVHRRATIERLAAAQLAAVRQLAARAGVA